MSTDPIAPAALIERVDNVLVITINRPEARNAVNYDVTQLVGQAVEQAEHDREIRVVVLTGSGDLAFSAGADLKAIARGEAFFPEGTEHWGFAGFVNHFTSKPTIAAVNGAALGGGTELVLACDLVVAAEHATFGLPETKRGLLAGAGGAFRLVAQLPHRIGLQALLTGDPIGAAEAHRWGLINEVVPAGKALDAALDLARRIADNAPLSVQASKRVAYGVHGGRQPGEADLWQLTRLEWEQLAESEDAKEGPRAFAEKRPPIWQAN